MILYDFSMICLRFLYDSMRLYMILSCFHVILYGFKYDSDLDFNMIFNVGCI